MTTQKLPASASLERLKKEAKSLLKSVKAGDGDALARTTTYFSDPTTLTLQQIQLVLAREYGFDSWEKLHTHVAGAHQYLPQGRFSDELDATLNRAFNKAMANQHKHLTTEHLLLELLDGANVRGLLEKIGCDVRSLSDSLSNCIGSTAGIAEDAAKPLPTGDFRLLLNWARNAVLSSNRYETTAEDVLVSFFGRTNTQAGELLVEHGVSRSEILENLAFGEGVADSKERAAIKLRSVADSRIRNTTEYVRRLFGEHVPEIASGVVRICAVGRIPGVWLKVAVDAHDPEVDPVHCCVGAEASRVQAISAALNGEGIDIIPWASDLPRDIANAIAPAIAEEIIIDESGECATVRVSDHQLAAALGPNGNNVRLASDVCQCRIDVESTARVLAEVNGSNPQP